MRTRNLTHNNRHVGMLMMHILYERNRRISISAVIMETQKVRRSSRNSLQEISDPGLLNQLALSLQRSLKMGDRLT